MSELARKNIAGIKQYIPGKPIEEVARELGIKGEIVKLASNENPLGTSPKALEALKKAIKGTHLYPDDEYFHLVRAIANRHGVEPECVMIANGSVEALDFITKAYVNPGDEVVMSEQAFALYRIVVAIMDGKRIATPLKNYAHDLDAMAAKITPKTKVVFIANPNNPTGTMSTSSELDKFMNAIPREPLVVLDEAYREYITRKDYPDSFKYLREGRNVMILGTFSKIYGLAGLRIGYAVSKPELVAPLRKVKMPFHVNSFAQAAALAAISDDEHIIRSREVNDAGKKYLYAELKKLGVSFVPTEANFIYIDVGHDCDKVFHQLLLRGVIVRPMKPYDFPTGLRVTIGTREQNEKFAKALKGALATFA
jgi:histidinol-phosphate aminotransferase